MLSSRMRVRPAWLQLAVRVARLIRLIPVGASVRSCGAACACLDLLVTAMIFPRRRLPDFGVLLAWDPEVEWGLP
jgi:hypothetical protein